MSEHRVKLIYIVFLLYFFVLVVRLAVLQVARGSEFRLESDRQVEGRIPIFARRGEIFSRDGYPLSQNQNAYVLNFDKNLQIGKQQISRRILQELAAILVKDEQIFAKETDQIKQKARQKTAEQYLMKIFSNSKVTAGAIYKKVSPATKIEIEKLNIAALFFTTESLRKYPESSMSAHILGFLGRDESDNLKGYFGLEGYYDLELKGIDGYKIYEKDPLGNPILLEAYDRKDPIDGRSLLTTIDRGAQKILEKWLQWGVKKYQAKAGSVILYEPERGEIIGMANVPSFDPNAYYRFPEGNQKNIAISDMYEPGSIMKPLVMAAALNEKLVQPTTRCPKCAGPREVSGYLIKTFDDQYLPNLTMEEVLQRSDNTGMTYVGELLGKKKLLEYFTALGFGQRTGVDLEGEVDGYVKPEKDIYDIDQATMTFGQGISVTSMQMIKAYGALVTGHTTRPHAVASLLSRERQDEIQKNDEKNVYRSETVKKITEMLTSVSQKSPLHFALDNFTPKLIKYQIAAKSGTAQIAVGGEYAKDKTVGTVIGFAPANAPKFILFVKLDEPQTNPWGANTAGPVFFQILQDLFIYYNIPPG